MRLDSIWVYGVGGVGGYFGGKIARAVAARGPSPGKVFFIARGPHLEEIRKKGLILNTSDQMGMICKPEQATDNADELPFPDLCLICVKSYDLDHVVRKLTDKIKNETVVIPLLNGVDIYERVRSILHRGVVLPACVYVGTHIEEPGVVTQKGGDGTILCGADPAVPGLDYGPVVQLLGEAGISFQWRDDPYAAIWEKYIFIAPFGLVTALFRKTLGEVFGDQALRELVRSIMTEIALLARKKGIELAEDVVDTSLAKAGNFPFETKTSFQRDVETKGRRSEADLFGGTIIRTGKALGIETPVTRSVYVRLQRAMRRPRAV
jgi:2-dehydropantoate 2-reductase